MLVAAQRRIVEVLVAFIKGNAANQQLVWDSMLPALMRHLGPLQVRSHARPLRNPHALEKESSVALEKEKSGAIIERDSMPLQRNWRGEISAISSATPCRTDPSTL